MSMTHLHAASDGDRVSAVLSIALTNTNTLHHELQVGNLKIYTRSVLVPCATPGCTTRIAWQLSLFKTQPVQRLWPIVSDGCVLDLALFIIYLFLIKKLVYEDTERAS